MLFDQVKVMLWVGNEILTNKFKEKLVLFQEKSNFAILFGRTCIIIIFRLFIQ